MRRFCIIGPALIGIEDINVYLRCARKPGARLEPESLNEREQLSSRKMGFRTTKSPFQIIEKYGTVGILTQSLWYPLTIFKAHFDHPFYAQSFSSNAGPHMQIIVQVCD